MSNKIFPAPSYKEYINTLITEIETEQRTPISFSDYVQHANTCLESLKKNEEKFTVSETLENLLAATETAVSPKIAELIDYIMQNEFQCFRTGCDDYKGVDVITAKQYLLNTIFAMRNLAENIPTQSALDFLLINQVKRKISSQEIFKFIQEHSVSPNFSTEFVLFLKEHTAEHTHGTKHSHRDAVIIERNNEILHEIKSDLSDNDIPAPPPYPFSDPDDWTYDDIPTLETSPQEATKFKTGKQLHNTHQERNESITPVTLPSTTSSNEINFLDHQETKNANHAATTATDLTAQNKCYPALFFFTALKNCIPGSAQRNKIVPIF